MILLLIEFAGFCHNETVPRLTIVDEEFGIGSVQCFLSTEKYLIVQTGKTVSYILKKNIFLFTAVIVTYFLLLVAAEFAYSDFSTLMDRTAVIITIIHIGGQIMTLTMSVDIII